MKTEQPYRNRLGRYHEPGDFHELTFSTHRRLPLLTNHDWRRRLARTIEAAGDEVNRPVHRRRTCLISMACDRGPCSTHDAEQLPAWLGLRT